MELKLSLLDLYPEVQKHFPDFDYHNPLQPELLNMQLPNNTVGHWQRAFSIHWAIKQCLNSGRIGLDIGSGSITTPYTLGIDMCKGIHPLYQTECKPVLQYAGEKLSDFSDNIFPLVLSNHSIEHMDVEDNVGIVSMLRNHWIRVLEPNGILAVIIPDNKYMNVLAVDISHVHAWTANDFYENIVTNIEDLVEVLEFNTFKNNHSFNFVARKKTKRC